MEPEGSPRASCSGHMKNPVCRLVSGADPFEEALTWCGRAVLTGESGLVCKSKGLVPDMTSSIGCVMLSIDE